MMAAATGAEGAREHAKLVASSRSSYVWWSIEAAHTFLTLLINNFEGEAHVHEHCIGEIADGAELATYAADLAVAIGTLRREKALLGGTHREQSPSSWRCADTLRRPPSKPHATRQRRAPTVPRQTAPGAAASHKGPTPIWPK